MKTFRNHPLFKIGIEKLRAAALHPTVSVAVHPALTGPPRTAETRPPMMNGLHTLRDDYTIPKTMMTTGIGLPGSGGERIVGKHPALAMPYGKTEPQPEPEPKMISTYMGVNVEDMTRAELISAVLTLGRALQDANASAAHYAKHAFDGFKRHDR